MKGFSQNCLIGAFYREFDTYDENTVDLKIVENKR